LPEDLNTLFTHAYAAGAYLHTNSWGASADGAYTANASEVDEFLWKHRAMLIFFSAGNDGVDKDQNGIIDPGSISSPGTAKNCLTVGACENQRKHGSAPAPGYDINWTDWKSTGQTRWPKLGNAGKVSDNPEGMAAFTSRGPTQDGRIKPAVVAPGTNVLSTRSTAYTSSTPPLWGDLPASDPLYKKYCWSGGTSMSTPPVAGMVALVRQHLVQQRDVLNPSGALIKAFLVNGAKPMLGQFPGAIPPPPPGTDTPVQNSVCGFGRADGTNALTPDKLHRALFTDDPSYALASGEHTSFQIQAIDTAEPLKITLVWTDFQAVAGTGDLVNQFYLRVRRPTAVLWMAMLRPFRRQ
jgi:subtilisin family serine protease